MLRRGFERQTPGPVRLNKHIIGKRRKRLYAHLSGNQLSAPGFRLPHANRGGMPERRLNLFCRGPRYHGNPLRGKDMCRRRDNHPAAARQLTRKPVHQRRFPSAADNRGQPLRNSQQGCDGICSVAKDWFHGHLVISIRE